MDKRESNPVDLARYGMTLRELRDYAAAKRAVVATGQAGRVVAEISASGRHYTEPQARTATGELPAFEATSSEGDAYELKKSDTGVRHCRWATIDTSR